MMERVSEHVIDNALENSNAWFKKKYPSRDVVADMFTPSIRYSKDKDTGELSTMYPPNFKLNLPSRWPFRFPVYGGDREPLDLNEILRSPKRGKGARVSAIIHLQSIWSVGLNKSFGVTWKKKHSDDERGEQNEDKRSFHVSSEAAQSRCVLSDGGTQPVGAYMPTSGETRTMRPMIQDADLGTKGAIGSGSTGDAIS
eukprot:gene9395-biopygen9327